MEIPAGIFVVEVGVMAPAYAIILKHQAIRIHNSESIPIVSKWYNRNVAFNDNQIRT